MEFGTKGGHPITGTSYGSIYTPPMTGVRIHSTIAGDEPPLENAERGSAMWIMTGKAWYSAIGNQPQE